MGAGTPEVVIAFVDVRGQMFFTVESDGIRRGRAR